MTQRPHSTSPATSRAVPAGTPLGTALQRLTDQPYTGDTLARASVVATRLMEALHRGDVEPAIAGWAELIRLEGEAPDEAGRRPYGVALRQLFTKQYLERVVPRLLDPLYADDVQAVMVRGGAEATNLLLTLLADAPTFAERRAYFKALCGLTEGAHLAIHLLGDPRWYVVRNMAELLGELGLEQSVPELGQALAHADARVRRSAAGALAKIGTPATLTHLRRALKEADRDTKLVVARAVEGKRSEALAIAFAVGAEEETDAELRQAYLLALGRIGSPDAVSALVRAAAPGGKLFGRKPTMVRVAAVQGLRLAGGPAAVKALEHLTGDGDRQVRETVVQALAALGR